MEEAIRRMEGIRCGSKATSCPDQLAQALKQAQAEAITLPDVKLWQTFLTK